MKIIGNSLEQSHRIIESAVSKGDTVVDATAGNGNDTVFLAGLVGKYGKVYSFDIQEKALENTRKDLADSGYGDRVFLIHDGHENMLSHICVKVKAVMFNLGYLPGGDHRIHTHPDTTIKAVNSALDILDKGGVICMVVYHGGDTGYEERDHLIAYIKTIDPLEYTVMTVNFPAQANNPPILVCIEKL
jgi:predicted methyltransferase